MYRVFPYYLSKLIVDTPILVLTPMISCLITYWAMDLSRTVDQFFGCYLVQLLCAMAAASIGYFLSSLFENEATATSLAPLCIMPLLLFGGLFTNNSNAVEWLGWIQYISPIKYCSEALMWNEFRYDEYGLKDNLLTFLGQDIGYANCVWIFLVLILFFRTIAYLTFSLMVKKFQ